MPKSAKKWIMNLVKVAIAVVGLWYVISTTPWNDRATVEPARMTDPTGKQTAFFLGYKIIEPFQFTVLDARPDGAAIDPKNVYIQLSSKPVKVLDANGQELHVVLTQAQGGAREMEIPRNWLTRVEGGNDPRIERGVKYLIFHANVPLLLLALLSLGAPFAVTSWRWMKLMQPQGISLPYSKCLALTFVGQFYSTFLPGSVSGDLIKIFYTSKVTGSKTKSTVTVLLDRVIGLIALMLIAGIAATFQMQGNPTMRNVVIMVFLIFAGLATGATVYFSHRLRRAFGLTRLLASPKVPDFIKHADEVLHAYAGHRGTLIMAFSAALVAQAAIPISAYIAGTAFGIERATLGNYLAYVPLASLAAALPISFLGLGVMDSVVFHFFYSKGLADASQTFALAQCIRFLPVLWNMLGAYWVVTGTYSRHQALEDEKENPNPAVDMLDSTLDPSL